MKTRKIHTGSTGEDEKGKRERSCATHNERWTQQLRHTLKGQRERAPTSQIDFLSILFLFLFLLSQMLLLLVLRFVVGPRALHLSAEEA